MLNLKINSVSSIVREVGFHLCLPNSLAKRQTGAVVVILVVCESAQRVMLLVTELACNTWLKYGVRGYHHREHHLQVTSIGSAIITKHYNSSCKPNPRGVWEFNPSDGRHLNKLDQVFQAQSTKGTALAIHLQI